MKAAILTVGTEILFGEITNTNSVFLSRRLNDMGIDVLYHHTVGDNPRRLAEMIGIDKGTLNKKFGGKLPFLYSEVVRICEILRIDNPIPYFPKTRK